MSALDFLFLGLFGFLLYRGAFLAAELVEAVLHFVAALFRFAGVILAGGFACLALALLFPEEAVRWQEQLDAIGFASVLEAASVVAEAVTSFLHS